MNTQVTQTSIDAFHSHPVKSEQGLKVAAYALAETRAGRPVWVGKIAEYFMLRGHPDLGQKSTASARLNDIKKRGVILDGERYRLEYVRTDKPPGGKVQVDMWALVLDKKESGQISLF